MLRSGHQKKYPNFKGNQDRVNTLPSLLFSATGSDTRFPNQAYFDIAMKGLTPPEHLHKFTKILDRLLLDEIIPEYFRVNETEVDQASICLKAGALVTAGQGKDQQPFLSQLNYTSGAHLQFPHIDCTKEHLKSKILKIDGNIIFVTALCSLDPCGCFISISPGAGKHKDNSAIVFIPPGVIALFPVTLTHAGGF